MPEDYYPEQVEDESNLPPEDASKEPKGETALLPKSLVGDVEPGATISLKIVHVYEDEVEVAMGESESAEETDKPMTADQEIDSMTEE